LKVLSSQHISALCEKRIELICKLESGDLTKEAFINENYEMMSPYQKVTFDVETLDEGVLKYHYFNTMAKKHMLEADAYEYRDPRKYEQLKNIAYDYYSKKDKISLKMLELVDFDGVQAYFIHMNSRSLEGLIYEIRFNDHEKVVLHSKDRKILYKLKEANCFIEERMPSVIEEYVNTKIY